MTRDKARMLPTQKMEAKGSRVARSDPREQNYLCCVGRRDNSENDSGFSQSWPFQEFHMQKRSQSVTREPAPVDQHPLPDMQPGQHLSRPAAFQVTFNPIRNLLDATFDTLLAFNT